MSKVLAKKKGESMDGKIWKRVCSFILMLALAGGGMSGGAQAETYPTRGIDLIVPFAPGGTTDMVARIVAPKLSEKWRVAVNVINQPGGNTVPATVRVMQAKPDGYTILADSQNAATVTIIVKDLPFKVTERTFMPAFAAAPFLMLVPSTVPWKTVRDVADAAKKNPENFSWVSGGGVSAQDYYARQFFSVIGVDVSKTRPVLITGGGPAVGMIAGGHVMMGGISIIPCMPAIKAGQSKALSINSKERSNHLPDVPTMIELGYPGVNVHYWVSYSGPPNMPSYVTETWNSALKELIADPKTLAQLNNIGAIPYYLSPSATKDLVAREMEYLKTLWGTGK